MSKSVNDPLESAKVSSENPAKKAKAAKAKADAAAEAKANAAKVKEAAEARAKAAEESKLSEAKAKAQLDAEAAAEAAESEISDSYEGNDNEKEEEPVVKAKEPSKAKPPQKYRVIATCKFSRGGYVTKLKAGSVISSQQYGGEPGILKLKNAGVQLEKLKG
jgi:colicin import membrane protein